MSMPSSISTNFQQLAGAQGKAFDGQCRMILNACGFDVSERPFVVAEVGVEMDAEIVSRDTGRTYWCEFKGSWQGSRPGLMRTDTTKKALADVLLLHVAERSYPEAIVLTSHLPVSGSSGDAMLLTARRCGALLDVFCVNNPADVARLGRL